MTQLLGILLLLCCAPISAAEEIVAFRTQDPPVIDGRLADAVWQSATAYEAFLSSDPVSGRPPSEKTVAYAAYDVDNLYFAFRCLDSRPENLTASMTKRDNISNEDKVGVFLDLYLDQQSAVGFMVNPLGVQEDVVADDKFDWKESEDFVWYSAGYRHAGGYDVELRIPLKSIRYSAGDMVTMGISFWRRIVRRSEWDTYPPVNRDKGTVLSQMATVSFRDLAYRRTLELLPSITHAYTDANGSTDQDPNLGLTSKVSLSSAFLLDATLYPDFNQVEADASQVEFNQRSAVIYDEKRPFFLEGTENLFVAGAGPYNNSHVPVVIHTRKIVDPLVGLKLTGRPGKSHVIAAVAAIDRSPKALENRSENAQFAIVRYKKLLGDDSYVGGLVTARELGDDYNRTVGADARFRLTQTTSFQFDVLGSRLKDQNTPPKRGYSSDVVLRYRTNTYQGDMSFNTTSEKFDLATGFIERQGIRSFNAGMERAIHPAISFLNAVKPAYWGRITKDLIYNQNETSHKYYLSFEMPRLTGINANYRRENEIYLGSKFDRSGWEVYASTQPVKQICTEFFSSRRANPFLIRSVRFKATNRSSSWKPHFARRRTCPWTAPQPVCGSMSGQPGWRPTKFTSIGQKAPIRPTNTFCSG
ncbi:MAG: DUF5916 domain-containing protein [bacterium]|nr:DUF5916 domain-containing protein [bacterium]